MTEQEATATVKICPECMLDVRLCYCGQLPVRVPAPASEAAVDASGEPIAPPGKGP